MRFVTFRKDSGPPHAGALVDNDSRVVDLAKAQKAAWDNGFRIERGIDAGWLHYASTTAKGEIWLGGGSKTGPWLLAVERPAVAAE